MIRESKLFWLLLAVAIIAYLKTVATPPNHWGYTDWLNAGTFLGAWLIGKMQSSPLSGKNDPEIVSPR